MFPFVVFALVWGYPSPHGTVVRIGDGDAPVSAVGIGDGHHAITATPPAPLAVDFKISDVTLKSGSLFVS